MNQPEFDRWLKLFNEHGEHNKPLTDAAAFVHDALRLSIASARTLARDPKQEETDSAEYYKLTPDDLALAIVVYDRVVDEMDRRREGEQ